MMATKLGNDVALYLTLLAVFAMTFAAVMVAGMRLLLWFDRRAALKAWVRQSEATRDAQMMRDRARTPH